MIADQFLWVKQRLLTNMKKHNNYLEKIKSEQFCSMATKTRCNEHGDQKSIFVSKSLSKRIQNEEGIIKEREITLNLDGIIIRVFVDIETLEREVINQYKFVFKTEEEFLEYNVFDPIPEC